MQGCIVLVALLAGPIIGLVALVTLLPRLIHQSIARLRCPLCGYDESGRPPTSVCPECGRDRPAAVAAAWPVRQWPWVVPLGAAGLCSLAIWVLTTDRPPGLLAWTIVCHAAPFGLLAIAGRLDGVRRWRAVALIAVAIPTVLLSVAVAWSIYFLAFPTPARPGTYTYERDLMRQIGPPLSAIFACGIIVWWFAAIALVLAIHSRITTDPGPPSEEPPV